MKSPLSRRIIASGAALLALLAAAAGPARPNQAHAASGVLVFPIEDTNLWLKNLDPALVTDLSSYSVIGMVYSGLVRLDGKNNVVPDLAAAMPTVSADRKTYTFKLRSNLKFSDGTPLTAQDVVNSLARALSKKEASPVATLYLGAIQGANDYNAGKIATLTGVTAPDASTVVFKLTSPISYFLQTLTYPTSFVLKSTNKPGTDMIGAGAQAVNIGSGPFRFSRPWRYRQEMFLGANPNWYDVSKLKLKEIDIPLIGSVQTEYNEYLSGQIPETTVPTSFLATVHNLPDFHAGPALAIDYISPNQGANSVCKPISCAPFNDIHFRRALMYAVDRNTLDNKILHGARFPLCGLIPSGMPGYDKSLCALTPYNPVRAKAELALAVKDFGGKLPNQGNYTAVYPSGNQDVTNEYTELQSEWAAVGININITSTSSNNWLTLVSSNYTPLLRNDWYDDYADPQDFAENLLSSKSPYNIVNFKNAQYDALMAQADVLPNGSERNALYVQAQKLAINNVAFIMVGQFGWFERWKPNLHGFMVAEGLGFYPQNLDWTNASVS